MTKIFKCFNFDYNLPKFSRLVSHYILFYKCINFVLKIYVLLKLCFCYILCHMVKMIENLGDRVFKIFFQNSRKESMILANLQEDRYFCASMHFYKFYMNINCPKPPIIIENCEILSNLGNRYIRSIFWKTMSQLKESVHGSTNRFRF